MEKNTLPKTRQSNFELLRIVLMLLVLLIHYLPVRMRDMGGDAGYTNDWLWDVVNLELKSLSIVCVNCFVLISGYWGIKLRLNSFLNLLFQMTYWSAVCLIMAIAIWKVPGIPVLQAFVFNIASGWFPKSYLALFILAPVVNCYIRDKNEKELLRYIGIFYLLSTIGGYVLRFEDFNEGMSAISLLGLYLIGAYLRKTTLSLFHLKARYDLIAYLGLGAFLVAASICLMHIGISKSPYGFLNPIVIVMSVYLFLFFKKIEIKDNKVINFLSASAFSVYLFHCNPLCFGEICKVWSWINNNHGAFTSLLLAFLSFVAIYLFCVLIDRIRILIYAKCIGGFIDR